MYRLSLSSSDFLSGSSGSSLRVSIPIEAEATDRDGRKNDDDDDDDGDDDDMMMVMMMMMRSMMMMVVVMVSDYFHYLISF